MRKTLNTLLLVGAAALGSGCVSQGDAPMAERNFPEGHLHGYNFNERTQKETPYNLERVVFFGKEFYAQKNSNNAEDELPFVIYPFDSVTRELDLDTKEVKLVSSQAYVPKKVISPCDDGPKEECYMDWIKLSTTKVGKIPGVKAEIAKFRVGGKDFLGSSRVTSEDNAPFGVMRANFLGDSYFFPHVENSKTTKNKLDFYLIPEKGAKIRMDNSDGAITLVNEGEIYRPTLVDLPREITIGISPGVAVGSAIEKRPVCPEFEIKGNSFVATPNLSISCVKAELKGKCESGLKNFTENFKEANPEAKFVKGDGLYLGEEYKLPSCESQPEAQPEHISKTNWFP